MTGARKLSYREALREAHREALARDERVFLIGEDVGRYGGSYAVSKGLLEEFGPERIRDAPLSESVRRDLQRGSEDDFADTKLYKRVFDIGDKSGRGRPLPRAVVPKIRLESPKITRKLTTEWFAKRVDERYERCLARR